MEGIFSEGFSYIYHKYKKIEGVVRNIHGTDECLCHWGLDHTQALQEGVFQAMFCFQHSTSLELNIIKPALKEACLPCKTYMWKSL